jgi:hypothetical protein
MIRSPQKPVGAAALGLSTVAVALTVGFLAPTSARADETDAKNLLKAMSDYMASQDAISFGYDANLDVVTKDNQRLTLASSGTVAMQRPDKFHSTRASGFRDSETFFDGKTLTLLGKNANIYAQVEIPGTVGNLIDTMIDKLDRTPPAADLLSTNSYDLLMNGVTDVKDLGSGVIDGVECDYLAFRTEAVDWQIWIAQGENPAPCRYTVTSKGIDGGPQYSIQFRDWKVGDQAMSGGFVFENASNAEMIDASDLGKKMSELPQHFKMGE